MRTCNLKGPLLKLRIILKHIENKGYRIFVNVNNDFLACTSPYIFKIFNPICSLIASIRFALLSTDT